MRERSELAGPYIFTVSGVLSPEECRTMIDVAEAAGFDEAPITTPQGFVRRPDIRNNTRVMIDRQDWADWLWERVQGLVPELEGWTPIGLNERFRLYRYDPGQYFAQHYDGFFERPDGSARSVYTMMVYLNDDFTGGETRFKRLDVPPKTGDALFFYHHQLHEGATLEAGRKYVLRTDVMCVRTAGDAPGKIKLKG